MRCYSALYLLVLLTGLVDAYNIPLRRIQLPATPERRPPSVVGRRHEGEHGPSAGNGGFDTVTVTQTVISTLGTPATAPTRPRSTVTHTVTSTSTVTPSTTSTSTTTSESPTSTSTSSSSTGATTTTGTTSTTSESQPEQTSAPGGKLVVAHHMVGNTFTYTKQDWLDDIKLAHKWGIDGFALNTGKDVKWEPARIADAYAAAEESKLDFKLFLSLDMASLPCTAPEHATYLRDLVLQHASHINQLKHPSSSDGSTPRAFVSTFAGENCLFGDPEKEDGVVDAWKTHFTHHPDIQGKVYFVPSFFIDPQRFGKFGGVMDGDFNWNSGWPIQVTTDFVKGMMDKLKEALRIASEKLKSIGGVGGGAVLRPKPNIAVLEGQEGEDSEKVGVALQGLLGKVIGSTESDEVHLSGLQALNTANKRDESGKPVYMAAVSPWFFTHYGADSFNKNFIFLADQHLYVKHWESLIKSRDQLDIVQILTWNDYGESHYIGPIKGAQPDSEAWTDGMDHTAWLELTKYYANAFKTGLFAEIEKDQIYMWSRLHPANAEASSDPLPKPKNFELSEDAIWVVVMTTAPSQVKLSTGGPDSEHTTFDVPAGVSKLSIPITPGGTMRGVIVREGKIVVELAPSGEEFTFQGAPRTYNYNAFVAKAAAE